jgi:hypothetical protein
MKILILFLILLLAILIYLYISKQENLTQLPFNPSSSLSNIWHANEILNIGDIKSSPNGQYKFVVTEYGLEFYNPNWKQFNLYPTLLLGSSNADSNTQVKFINLPPKIGFQVTQINETGFLSIIGGGFFTTINSNNLNNFSYFELTNDNINGYDTNNNLILQLQK